MLVNFEYGNDLVQRRRNIQTILTENTTDEAVVEVQVHRGRGCRFIRLRDRIDRTEKRNDTNRIVAERWISARD